MAPRWKYKGAEAEALAEPISKSVSELQHSLAETKSSGRLLGFNVRLKVEPEQAELLERCCFGIPVITAEKVKKIQLTFEEAFFLLYNLKCIKISLQGRYWLNEVSAWLHMKFIRPNFPIFFTAYSHLRSRNWILRSGSLYGVDFVAYRHHPSRVHSEFAVLVQSCGDSDRLRVWSDIHCTVRLSGGVAKTLLTLYVKGNSKGEKLNLPSCLENYTVEAQTISRWSPELSREDETANSKPNVRKVPLQDSGAHVPLSVVDDGAVELPTSSVLGSRKAPEAPISHNSDLLPHAQLSFMAPRWKRKGAQAEALAEPISKSVSELQLSLAQTKTSGSLLGCVLLLEVEPEQAELLERCCLGRLVPSVEKVKKRYQFTFEEAFFLLYNLKCIKICIKISGRRCYWLNEVEAWLYMKSKRPSFPISFKAYSHLRLKNWILRPGFLYGVDLVAYRHHPCLVHSQFAVLVKSGGDSDRLKVWSDIHCCVRLSGSVAKKLLTLYVNGVAKGEEMNLPSCLGNYTVEEHTISRWSPELSREDDTANSKPNVFGVFQFLLSKS